MRKTCKRQEPSTTRPATGRGCHDKHPHKYKKSSWLISKSARRRRPEFASWVGDVSSGRASGRVHL
eukprot:scaffold26749_cov17-Prasinocladus_malaysianus.AAC.2